MRIMWTDEESKILEKHFPSASWEELLRLLPRFTEDKIRNKAARLGLKREIVDRPSKNKKMQRWSAEETSKLKNVYPHTTNKELLELFPRFTLRQISYKANQLKLEKSPEVIEEDLRIRVEAMHKGRMWTEEEDKILEENYESLAVGEQMRKLLPNRSDSAIRTRAQKLGLFTSSEARWTMTKIQKSDNDMFSIKTTFERLDR